MLKDSIYWRMKKIDKCINNTNGKQTKCRNGCNTKCECFKRWIDKKKTEWGKIRNHFYTQEDIEAGTHDIILEGVLQLEFSKENSTEDAENNVSAREIDLINEMLKEDKTTAAGETDSKKKNTIDWLIQHEEDEAELCLEIHEEDEKCIHDDEEDEDDDHEEEVYVSNPCATPSGSYPSLANKVAYQMHEKAKTQLSGRAGGRKALKANASLGTYKRGGNGKDFKNLCSITKNDSNDSRPDGEPCKGKGERFKKVTIWEKGTQIDSTEEIFLPPRRQHMCTSNLEKLEVNSVINNRNGGTAGDSLLGDVLLAVKYEGQYIVNNNKSSNDKSEVCRAMKYSFADLGDIIKGTDLWVNNQGENETQRKLKEIFGSIHKSLKENKTKYTDDSGNYTNLRKDWWEANRHKVWNAMKCATKKDKNMKCNGIPIEDYIPQRLRWMTEWAEWFCKEQSRLYDELLRDCGSCMSKNKGNGGQGCTSSDRKCTQCKAACDKYKKVVGEWEKQWQNMQVQYLILYKNAETTAAGTVLGDVSDQQVLEFFKELQKEIKNSASKRSKRSIDAITTDPTTPYSTAAGYIHQELGRTVGCDTQTQFCKDKNGSTSSGTENKEYAFREKPYDHEKACKCNENTPPSPPKKEEPACEIVKKLFENEASKDYTDWCTQKYSGKNSYRSWDCRQSTFKKEHQGACMPPRRKYLYIHKLKNLNSDKTSTDIELRKAFIECAAIETFFAWYKYKEEQKTQTPQKGLLGVLSGAKELSSDNPQEELKRGIIPEEFKRQMVYTFSDYRGLCLGKDIDNSDNTIKISSTVKSILEKEKNGAKSITPENWWETNGEDIWEGMLCALSYDANGEKIEMDNDVRDNLIGDTKKKNNKYDYDKVTINSVGPNGDSTSLLNFAKRPPFFRWLQEWGEEFCRKRTDKLKKAKDMCQGYNAGGNKIYCSGDGYDCTEKELKHNDIFAQLDCRDCHEKCTNYKKWIKNKEKQFHNQKLKYQKEITQLSRSSKNDHDQTFYEEIINKKNISSFEKFLESLNHCKEWEDKNDLKNKTDFNKPVQTFSPSTYCKACPIYGVNCNGNKRGRSATNGCTANNEPANKDNAEGVATTIPILINDGATDDSTHSATKDSYGELNGKCKQYGLYNDLRKQEWKCQHINNIYKCELQNHMNSEYYDEKIPFNILFHRWLIDFIQYYNKSKKQINLCTKDGEKQCIRGCEGKCECAEKWLEIKKKEWDNIKKYYEDHLQTSDELIPSRVKSFFEQIPFNTYADEAKKVVEEKGEQENLWGCTGRDGCESKEEREKYGDFITNLISKLKDKIESCKKKHNEGNDPNSCVPKPPENEPEDEPDDPDTPEDKQSPEFCMAIPKPVLPETKDACEIVGGILKGNDGTTAVGECHPKNKDKNYPDWQCGNETLVTDKNTCMPPRRQKLCLYYLADTNEQNKIHNQDELRDAFIRTAAAETFLSWNYYKKKNDNAETQLNNGTIPPEFLRSMFYTYGDYRDICMDTDISAKTENGDITKAKNTIDRILPKEDGKTPDEGRKAWWDGIKEDVWKGMLCGLSHHIGGNEKEREKFTNSEAYKYSTVSSRLEDFAYRPQFLRWFTEWADQFCTEREEQLQILKKGCENYTCNGDNDKKQQCKTACEQYQNWLSKWKEQYKQQSAKFDKEKKAGNYEHTSAQIDADDSYSAREYLHEQLKKLCTNGHCKCMENSSTQDEEIELSGINDFPEAMDYPPKEINKKCDCAIPPEPMSCVERTAQQLRKIAEKNIDAKLKGNGNRYNDNCNKVTKDEYREEKGEKCIFKDDFLSSIGITNNECESKKNDRFKIEEEWKCEADTTDGKNKLCVPPRRKSMCLKKLENIVSTGIIDSKTLLEKIQDVAQNEGDDIIKNLLPENPCKENIICDAMKYSFADIGDIIRGRSKIKPNNGDNIEDKLKEIFKKIQDDNASLNKMELNKFREKWWDTNRKEVWKAMTCNSPKDAYLKKKKNNPGSTESVIPTADPKKSKCAHDSEPPDYDYIPERYRFLQEWSEYYCKALNKKKDEMESHCSKCLENGAKCEKEEDKEKCKECNAKCEEYKNIVDKWKSQFDEQNKFYKELYMKAKAASKSDARRDSSIKFTKKLEETCENPDSADEYLDISTHCTDYKFSETNNNENDAFSKYPKGYKDKCKCHENSTRQSDEILNFIKEKIFKSPKIPGIKTIQNLVPQIPRTIKNISPDAHTIHAIVARSFDYFVPLFQEDDKTPPTNNILNDVLPSAIPVGIALALTSIAFLYLKVIYICGIYICAFVWVLLDIYINIYMLMYMCFCICVCFIYILYIFMYLYCKRKKEKKKKKRK